MVPENCNNCQHGEICWLWLNMRHTGYPENVREFCSKYEYKSEEN